MIIIIFSTLWAPKIIYKSTTTSEKPHRKNKENKIHLQNIPLKKNSSTTWEQLHPTLMEIQIHCHHKFKSTLKFEWNFQNFLSKENTVFHLFPQEQNSNSSINLISPNWDRTKTAKQKKNRFLKDVSGKSTTPLSTYLTLNLVRFLW